MTEKKIETLNIDPVAFVNEVIWRCRKLGFREDLTHLKLQKLLYYCYAKVLKKAGKPPFSPQKIEFWQYGPVMPFVYDALKIFRNDKLVYTYADYANIFLKKEKDSEDYHSPVYVIEKIKEDEETKPIIDSIEDVLKEFRYHTAGKLVDITHSENSAWRFLKESCDRDSSKDENKNKRPSDEYILSKITEELDHYEKSIKEG